MLIGIMGNAAAGKDTIANIMVEDFGFVKISFADVIKRICREVFDFSEEQLWGSSEVRSQYDERYIRIKPGTIDGLKNLSKNELIEYHKKDKLYLTPRDALQGFGTVGRECCEPIWIDYALGVVEKILLGGYEYDKLVGLIKSTKTFNKVVISDVRFINEFNKIKSKNGKIIRIIRPNFVKKFGFEGHVSEMEQKTIPDSDCDYIVYNDGTLADLRDKTHEIFNAII